MNNNIPRTPFSTALSGSARETERRIRNIFSGPKKRPPVLFLTLIFTVCLLCGNLVSFRAQAVAADTPSISREAGLGLTSLIDRFKSLFAALRTDMEQYYEADSLDREDEFDALKDKNETAWEEAQLAEYRAVGVTKDGKNYYYQGQLVNIFLDLRPNKSFYTLDVNPAGTVNIQIIRNANNEITGVAYMTEAEVAELLDERREEAEEEKDALKAASKLQKEDVKAASKAVSKAAWLAEHEDDWDNWEPDTDAPKSKLDIPVNLETVAGGEIIWLGEYTLSEGDRVRYNVSAKTGSCLQIGFAKPGDEDLNTTYYSVNNLRKDGSTLNCNADMTFRPPVKPGTYALFLRAPEDTLGHVTGSISLERSAP